MTKRTKSAARMGPLSGRFTRNGWLTAPGVAVLAGLGSAFVLSAMLKWSTVRADVMTVLTGDSASATVVEMTDAPSGAPDGAYVVMVEFDAGGAGPRRASRQLVAPTGDGVNAGSTRIRLDRPVTVSYHADAPDRVVLWTLHEPWTALWTVPVGLALIGIGWALRPRT